MSAVPEVLTALLDDIRADDRTDTFGKWERHGDGRWSLEITAKLSVPASEFVPEDTAWHLVVDDSDVFIFPDREFGIQTTFQHQDFNGEIVSGRPWRYGKPCLEQPIFAFHRTEWDEEPRDLGDRMRWKIGRLLDWIDAAASGRLVAPGDPLELPAGSGNYATISYGFIERPEDLPAWLDREDNWGFAKLTLMPGAKDAWYVREFDDAVGKPVRTEIWNPLLAKRRTDALAVWLRTPRLPVFEPWRMPRTWAELSQNLAEQDVDLPAIIERAGEMHRRRSGLSSDFVLMLGFPLESRVGDQPERLHWLAIGKLKLAGRHSGAPKGLNRQVHRKTLDRDFVQADVRLDWRSTKNWASDQIRTRGQAGKELRSKSVLVIGCGSLGGAVASNLLRMGVTQLGLFDGDRIEIGNLSRHVLTMMDIGQRKSRALGYAFEATAPDANISRYPYSFPPERKDAEEIKAFDVVVDCTGDDRVLDSLASFDWGGEKLFVSLSIGWGANTMFCYAASEAMFPALDAKASFAGAPRPAGDVVMDAGREGIGCWSPVFPAGADDMQLWAAIGTKFVRKAVLEPGRRYARYSMNEDGSVALSDA
ncbi:MAG: ThiF family adenylyltransferase [Pseudomonadota bacterium]